MLMVATPDGKVHIFDWKTCSWGWDAKKRSDQNGHLSTYILYKHLLLSKNEY
jgi:hypothetical protein